MPKRTDIASILLIGSGPIVIGQACEFDYSGTQAIKALKEEGFKVILINSNPATIMTDPEFADRTYIEPITAEFVQKVIERERPDAILPTMGGQTALNVTIELHEKGILDKYDCKLIGAKIDSIKTAEDRELFKKAMNEIGLQSAKSDIAKSVKDAKKIAEKIGYPLILRPSRTLGGAGGGIVEDPSELITKVSRALAASPNKEVLIEQSLLGWKEVELEVMRDLKDNVVIVCAIENFDPMGVHTGDSITVAPLQTVTDKEYQLLRDAAIKIIRRIGVETGGSNVQFALNPRNGQIIIIEMNPRVSRSSALASKATGFPIAKIAAKLAVGYTLDEITNDITRETPACFEPSIDYVVVKIPRFNFEKFPLADPVLGTQMKSVGEVLSFGRTFPEALQKAMNSMEMDTSGFDAYKTVKDLGAEEVLELCKQPQAKRLWLVGEAIRAGVSISELYNTTGIDTWFLKEIEEIILAEERIKVTTLEALTDEELRDLKKLGFSDKRIAVLLNEGQILSNRASSSKSSVTEHDISALREKFSINPVFKAVDTCAGEFKSYTPYLYSTYDTGTGDDEFKKESKGKIVILGSGPNRIGQGIEFDYCCVHAAMALRKDGYEVIMINCNPETVSTDYDTSDKLYFEPLTFESVLSIVKKEKPVGVITQFGGQTPLKIAGDLHKAGVPIIGTSVDSIDIAEDRERFTALVQKLKLLQPECALAGSPEEAYQHATTLGFPLIIRPSFVLGGRAMRVVNTIQDLKEYILESVEVSNERPVLIDRYLHNAVEVDVDAVCDGEEVCIAGILEHVERAGIHSGDSSCCTPSQTLKPETLTKLQDQASRIAKELSVVGLINIQFAIIKSDDDQTEIPYILEANPRASRTVPFISKANGVQWAKIASLLMVGHTLKSLNINAKIHKKNDRGSVLYCAVKASVFPFNKFQGVDIILGPEMKSTGEVMGIDEDFAKAFAKAQLASSIALPTSGTAFMSVSNQDKEEVVPLCKKLLSLGFKITATSGTAEFLASREVKVTPVKKVKEGSPNILDMIGKGEISFIINTPEHTGTLLDSRSIRLAANEMRIPTYTTIAAASAAVYAIESLTHKEGMKVKSIQEYHGIA
jgi:carbamoyl-phosphate synthase large subunit